MGRQEEFGGGADHGRMIDLTDGPKTVHLPPTPEAMDRMTLMVGEHQEHVRDTKAKEARESDQESKTRASQYGLGGSKALRRHIAESHELLPEDAKDMERPAYYHRLWHTMGEYNPDGHTHA